MSKRWAWLLGAVLVLIGFLMACGSVYNHASDGLVVVTSQGSSLVQSYSFSLGSGGAAEVTNSVNDTATETCVLPGIPGAVVIDPAGQYAYVTLQGNAACPVSGGGAGPNGIQAFKINSDGTVTATGSLVPDPNPTQMVIDSSGKYLFVAEGTGPTSNYCQTALCVDVYAIGSGASLTAVPQTITLPATPSVPNLAALAISPTVFPGIVNGAPPAVCSTTTPPTAEYLYVVDSTNYLVWQFGVNAGVLGFPGANTALRSIATGTVPAGIAIDPCDRFVYVSNNISNQISAYSICNGGNTQNLTKCPSTPDGSLYPIAGSPFSNSGSATYPGPLIVDAYGNFLYVLNGVNGTLLPTGGSITPFRISSVNGAIQPLTPPVVSTGNSPRSIAMRADDTWLFVTNFNGPPTLSEYSVTPATGTLTPIPQIPTDNYPFGLAVK